MNITELKEARLKLGLTQKAIAEALNTPLRTYEDWEGGRRRIPGICEIAVKNLLQKKRGK